MRVDLEILDVQFDTYASDAAARRHGAVGPVDGRGVQRLLHRYYLSIGGAGDDLGHPAAALPVGCSSLLPLACTHRPGDELCVYDAFVKAFMRCRYAAQSGPFPLLRKPGSLVGVAFADGSARRRCLTGASVNPRTDR